MKKMKRLIAVIMTMVMMFSVTGIQAAASETTEQEAAAGSGYEKTDSYALNFNRKYGPYAFEYPSPYWPQITYKYVEEVLGVTTPYQEYAGVNIMYNTQNEEETVSVYCVDEYTGIPSNGYYERLNLEDSTFFSDEQAGKLRSIILNGFPYRTVEEVGTAAGVENLTLGEVTNAMQLAVWQTSYGSELIIHEFVNKIGAWWRSRSDWQELTKYDTECYEEIENGYAVEENREMINSRIEKVFHYLTGLEPTGPKEATVSGASFVSFSEYPEVTDNGDGTYNLTVEATVDVDKTGSDTLTLTAAAGDYAASQTLNDGTQTVSLTIENVSAQAAKEAVTLNIDGIQTVSDVYIYAVEGGREAAQEYIGYSDLTLPVHAEVTVEPELIINFVKTGKVATGEDTYKTIPLEGIIFDIYFYADWDEYMNGNITLPDTIDVSSLGDSNYHYPDLSVVTDEEGKAVANLTKNNLSKGVYVIAERASDAVAQPIDPFYILLPYTNSEGTGWEYEITINPKNEVINDVEIEKDVIELNNNSATVDAYKAHTWIISATIPSDIGNGKEFIISDTLDYRLDYLGNVKVQVESTSSNVEEPVVLTEGTHYILTVTDNDSLGEGKASDSFTIELTANGMKAVADAAGNDFANHVIRVYFDAQINANAVMGEMIPNQAVLDYTNSVNVDFDAESDIPEVHTGGASISKVDAKDEEVKLAGAVFKVYRPATVEELEDESIEKYTLTEDADTKMVLVSFFDNSQLSGEKVTEATSDENGNVWVYGLAYGTYYLVETQAPTGYNLLPEPKEIIIDESSHLAENVVVVVNNSGVELPETGGMGTTLFTTVGLLLVIGAGVTLITRKRMEYTK